MSEDADLHEQVRAAWDALAGFWDEKVEAGESWQRHLVYPAVDRLLELRPGERVLEIACGNGGFARRMAEVGASVLATDFSEAMLERSRAHRGDVEYRSVDATDEGELLELAEPGLFDAVVANMAIMDIETIEPMASASARLLRPGGRFVFSVLHPAFNSGDATPTSELVYRGGDWSTVYSVKVSGYGTSSTSKGTAVPGQPVEQWYFHRPLAELLRPFFEHGFALDGLEEPRVEPEHATPGSPDFVYTQIPGVLVGRLRRPA